MNGRKSHKDVIRAQGGCDPLLEYVQFFGPFDRLRAAVHAEFAVDGFDVRAHGVEGDEEPIGNLPVFQPLGYEVQDVQLSMLDRKSVV